ncbi:MAG: MBL fold metallo-hydrolase [Patescibacteria group bacterium]
MVLTYYGKACVKVTQGDTTIAFNPFGKGVGDRYPRFGADIVLVSRKSSEYNASENMSAGEKMPFVIDGPGEYEVGGIFIKGYGVPNPENVSGPHNTIYSLVIDDIKLCHLGGLQSSTLPPDTLEQLGEIDIVFVPVWKGDVLPPADAYKLAASLEPKLVIPLANGEDEKDAPLATFMKEAGESKNEWVDKLTLKRKDLEGKEGDIILISPGLS